MRLLLNSFDSFNSFWRDQGKRNLIFQLLVLGGVLALAYFLMSNTEEALKKQNLASGFHFLSQEAAFGIGETLIDYSAENTFGRALLVGLLNTLLVAFLGNALAILWGTFLGVGSLSPNWALAKLAKIYVNSIRNIPLLLQLFLWYSLITQMLPPVRNALEILPYTYLAQRGLVIPLPKETLISPPMVVLSLLGLVLSIFLYHWQSRRRQETGKGFPFLPVALGLILLPSFFLWLGKGAHLDFDIPTLQGFNFKGGLSLGPEFTALLLGLVLYTGAFIGEIVRSGIQSVSKGQWEAAASLGLTRWQTLRLVILPQSLRVTIPPLTGQMLNLTKNSSLAVAIGYSDFVNVANTTLNQTGQAIECIALIMAVYLSFSLLTSLFMNWYNHRTQLKGVR